MRAEMEIFAQNNLTFSFAGVCSNFFCASLLFITQGGCGWSETGEEMEVLEMKNFLSQYAKTCFERSGICRHVFTLKILLLQYKLIKKCVCDENFLGK